MTFRSSQPELSSCRSVVKMASIRKVTRLPSTGPFPTPDPFLFCVYHVDDYPADESGGKMQTAFPGNGADFDPNLPYRMYHG